MSPDSSCYVGGTQRVIIPTGMYLLEPLRRAAATGRSRGDHGEITPSAISQAHYLLLPSSCYTSLRYSMHLLRVSCISVTVPFYLCRVFTAPPVVHPVSGVGVCSLCGCRFGSF